MLFNSILPLSRSPSLTLVHPAVLSVGLPLSYISSTSSSLPQFMDLSCLSVLSCPHVSKSTPTPPPPNSLYLLSSIPFPFVFPFIFLFTLPTWFLASHFLVLLFHFLSFSSSLPFTLIGSLQLTSKTSHHFRKSININYSASQQFHWADFYMQLLYG